jgi:cell division protein FtsW (lipid II flippase)
MRQLGVSSMAWAINIAALCVGLVIWFVGRRLGPLQRPATRAFVAAASLGFIVLPFAFEGMLGVHRWISVAGLRLHASSIAAPLILLSIAAAASYASGRAVAAAVSAAAVIILALQPDAAQTISLAAAAAVLLVAGKSSEPYQRLLSAALVLALSLGSFIRRDPLPPVAHVEEIFAVVASRGAGPSAMATVALLLLTVPFFAAWQRHRHPVPLALGVYIAMTLLAPAWGTFPVPVMGYGASPILGYFLALTVGLRRPSRLETVAGAAQQQAPASTGTRAR